MNDTEEIKSSFDLDKLETVQVATDYPMEPEEYEKLYKHNCYCEMAHINKKGYPIVTPMFYVILDDGFLYMSSAQKYRKKVHALEANPKISVTIHNDGSNANKQKAILIIGEAEVSSDLGLMTEVHWKIIDKYRSELKDEESRQAAFAGVHTPNRAIIKIIPEKVMSWDFGKMVNSYQEGVWFNESYKMIKQHI
ncbi:MAG: nitroimidazol reductase NimA-like FMN-containing flavoprotein [Planctomycetota bacterium]|jgi:nitroimidazol reductase NimA-like FMN-containing flavoprotein (pyridoxamine 5'-phosphate oxidase superfamily)